MSFRRTAYHFNSDAKAVTNVNVRLCQMASFRRADRLYFCQAIISDHARDLTY
jgi:hypothetical protein